VEVAARALGGTLLGAKRIRCLPSGLGPLTPTAFGPEQIFTNCSPSGA
jgi:hypothetical protein